MTCSTRQSPRRYHLAVLATACLALLTAACGGGKDQTAAEVFSSLNSSPTPTSAIVTTSGSLSTSSTTTPSPTTANTSTTQVPTSSPPSAPPGPPTSGRAPAPRAVPTLGVSPPANGPLPDGYYSVFVKSLSNDTIVVDPTQWLMADDIPALTSAGRLVSGDGTSDCFVRIAGGHCIPIMDDGYTIINDSTQTWTVPLAATFVASLYDPGSFPIANVYATLAAARTAAQPLRPFWLTVQGGHATRLEQQFTP
jgi:hypothetical protein